MPPDEVRVAPPPANTDLPSRVIAHAMNAILASPPRSWDCETRRNV